MKKITFTIITMIFALSINAQIVDDDFESYDLGQIGAANPEVWSVWSGTPTDPTLEDITISNRNSLSGERAGYILGRNPTGGPQDALLLLGNQVQGKFTLKFNMFIPTGKTGYFNIQGELEDGGAGNGGSGNFLSSNIIFNNQQSADGAPGVGGLYTSLQNDALVSWNYPDNDWFEISIFFDIAAEQYTMTIDGVSIAPQVFDAPPIIGGIDFFALDINTEYYVDDVLFEIGTLSTNDISLDKNFGVYPNPVVDILNLRTTTTINSIKVFDTLGKLVIQTEPNSISPSVNMTSLKSGLYFVSAASEGSSKTIKIIKH